MTLDIRSIGPTRKKLGLTQLQLARLSGVSQSLIAKIESGEIDPTYSRALSIFHSLENELNKRKDTKKVTDVMTKNIIHVGPADSLGKVIEIMKQKAISQLPVFDDRLCVGSVNDEMFVDWFTKYGNKLDKIRVGEVMQECFPTIPNSTDLSLVVEMLRFHKAILVIGQGKAIGIITKSDLIKAMRQNP